MGTSADVTPPNVYMAWSRSKERLNWHPPFWFNTLDNMWFPILNHHIDVIMSAMASQITGISVVCSFFFYWGGGGGAQIKENIKTSRHRWPLFSPHKRPVTWKMIPFDYFITRACYQAVTWINVDRDPRRQITSLCHDKFQWTHLSTLIIFSYTSLGIVLNINVHLLAFHVTLHANGIIK